MLRVVVARSISTCLLCAWWVIWIQKQEISNTGVLLATLMIRDFYRMFPSGYYLSFCYWFILIHAEYMLKSCIFGLVKIILLKAFMAFITWLFAINFIVWNLDYSSNNTAKFKLCNPITIFQSIYDTIPYLLFWDLLNVYIFYFIWRDISNLAWKGTVLKT